jgi:CubicO group peptidase (beta-lactamase class C family)
MKEKINFSSSAVDSLCEEKEFSGVIQIDEENSTVYSKAFGYADIIEKRKNNMDTLFAIASGTKFFTALGIGILIDRGLFTLDTPAKELFDLNIKTYSDNITIRHLLSHTSGMPDYYIEEDTEKLNDFEPEYPFYKLVSPKDYLVLFPKEPMKFQPGERFEYNNSGFVYLAMIIEHISGKSYKEFIEEEIFRKNGLTRSGIFPFNALSPNTAWGYIVERDSWKSNIYKLPIQAGGDGGIYICAGEMKLIWKYFFKNKIISADLVNEFITPQTAVPVENDDYYGLGLWLRPKKAYLIPYIVGSDPGISFISSYDPYKISYTFLVSNTTDGVWNVISSIRQ